MNSVTRRGFTIVELLIVIVVIGILAGITIVAYNGIQNRAKVAAAQSTASQVAKKVAAYAVLNADSYPETLEEIGFTSDTTVNYQYSVNNTANPKTFCATVTASSTSYFVPDTKTSPSLGGCPGHNAGGVDVIRNLVTNTSIETDLTSLQTIGNPAARSIQRQVVGDAISGTAVLRLTSTSGGSMGGYGSVTGIIPVGVYTASAWVRSNTSSLGVMPYIEGSATKSTVSNSGTAAFSPNVWRRVHITINVTVAGTVKVGFLINGTALANDYIEADGFMLTSGSTLYAFADGNTDNWVWEGAVNASLSKGLPI